MLSTPCWAWKAQRTRQGWVMMESPEIKWTNIICFALLIFSVWMLLHMHEEVASFLGALGELGPNHPGDRRMFGLVVFTIVGVIVVGVLKVLMQTRR